MPCPRGIKRGTRIALRCETNGNRNDAVRGARDRLSFRKNNPRASNRRQSCDADAQPGSSRQGLLTDLSSRSADLSKRTELAHSPCLGSKVAADELRPSLASPSGAAAAS
jgi:hypothetical protein